MLSYTSPAPGPRKRAAEHDAWPRPSAYHSVAKSLDVCQRLSCLLCQPSMCVMKNALRARQTPSPVRAADDCSRLRKHPTQHVNVCTEHRSRYLCNETLPQRGIAGGYGGTCSRLVADDGGGGVKVAELGLLRSAKESSRFGDYVDDKEVHNITRP